MAKVDPASRRWLHRPLHRDWALWIGLLLGLGYWVWAIWREDRYGDVTWPVALLDLPLHLLAGLFGFACLVGVVRQFRLGLRDGRASDTPQP